MSGKRNGPRLLVALLLAALAFVFALLNRGVAGVNLLIGTVSMPLYLLIVACVAVGAAIGWFLGRRR